MAMTHEQMLAFVQRMTHMGLKHVQHFDSGGTALGGPVTAGTGNAVNPSAQGIAGGIGGFLGTNNNFQATGANIQQGTNAAQLNQAYTGVQGALGQTNQFANQVNPGVGQGVNTQSALTQQLMNQANGVGPNPAQAALNQQTGQNIAQAAALAAGTRGAGANAGLIAQNAAQQGANTQQQAVGQAATLQAQQQLAAQSQLQNLAAQQIGQGQGAVGLQNQAQQNEQNILQNANTAANQQAVSQQENINNVNAQIAAGNQAANQKTIAGVGNAINGVGSLFGKPLSFAKGGKVPDHIHKMAAIFHPHLYSGGSAMNMGGALKEGGSVPGKPMVNHDAYKNDVVDAKLTPGEVVIDLNTLHDKGELGKMARFVAKNIERKKVGRKLK